MRGIALCTRVAVRADIKAVAEVAVVATRAAEVAEDTTATAVVAAVVAELAGAVITKGHPTEAASSKITEAMATIIIKDRDIKMGTSISRKTKADYRCNRGRHPSSIHHTISWRRVAGHQQHLPARRMPVRTDAATAGSDTPSLRAPKYAIPIKSGRRTLKP